MTEGLQKLSHLLGRLPHPVHLSYGTAGFRSKASNLEEAVFRVGILAAARSFASDGAPVGVMITASHNPPEDNGVKIVEPDGSMLHPQWEEVATTFVNLTDDPLNALSSITSIPDMLNAGSSHVIVGMDTRESSPRLLKLLCEAIRACSGTVTDLGVVTTPILHYCVRGTHKGTETTPEEYYTHLSKGYTAMMNEKNTISPIVVDCANGVGASAMKAISSVLPTVHLVNRPGDGPLNEKCGADFVQKKRLMPSVSISVPDHLKGACWASLDGDADRLVMYKCSEEKDIILADGDKFAALVAWFLSKHLKLSNTQLSVAVAQTAYSNGAATEFLQTLPGIEVVIAKTGVKHLEKAVHSYDIGIYWEPNGHGTVLYSEQALNTLHERLEELKGDPENEQLQSVRHVISVSRIANQAVGDGPADLLLILSILSCEGMTFDSWLGLYTERCSSNMVVRVKDKSVIRTEDCDRLVVEPDSLKVAVEKASSGEECRAFVRPSGTEDVVRVYAEAPSGHEDEASRIARTISQAVYDFCDGVGTRA